MWLHTLFMQEWDALKIRAGQQLRKDQPLKLTAAMGTPRFTECVNEMQQLLAARRLPTFALELQMGPILERGNAELADFLHRTSPVFNAVLARYQQAAPGAPPTKLVNCLVGGGINVPGTADLIQEALHAGPTGFDVVDAEPSDVTQVARGCFIYRMMKVTEGSPP